MSAPQDRSTHVDAFDFAMEVQRVGDRPRLDKKHG